MFFDFGFNAPEIDSMIFRFRIFDLSILSRRRLHSFRPILQGVVIPLWTVSYYPDMLIIHSSPPISSSPPAPTLPDQAESGPSLSFLVTVEVASSGRYVRWIRNHQSRVGIVFLLFQPTYIHRHSKCGNVVDSYHECAI